MSQKRINKRQQELLVDQLVQNMTLARGNTAEPEVKQFWVNLAVKLNALGCSRTAREWQHVWQMWVQKVRVKARKVRDSVAGTGGGPSTPPLTDQENKILQVTGRAAVFGFTSQETPLRPVQDEESARGNAPAPEIEDPWTPLCAPVASPPGRAVRAPSADSDQGENILEAVPRATPVPVPVPEVSRRPRRRTARRPCRGQPAVTELYLERLQQNCNVLREAITESANTIAAALMESATIIADALGSR